MKLYIQYSKYAIIITPWVTTHNYGDKKTVQSGHEVTGAQGTTDRKQDALKESNLTDPDKKKTKGPVSFNLKKKW